MFAHTRKVDGSSPPLSTRTPEIPRISGFFHFWAINRSIYFEVFFEVLLYLTAINGILGMNDAYWKEERKTMLANRIT